MSTKKKFLIWTIVTSVIVGVFSLYCMLALVNNIAGVLDTVKESLIQTYPDFSQEDIAAILNSTANVFLFTAIVNAIGAIYAVVMMFIDDKKFCSCKLLSIIVALLVGTLGANVIAAILLAFALRSVQAQPMVRQNADINTMQLSNEEIREQLKMRSMAEKITIIKQLKANGGITDEEYEKLLNEIISSGVKE